MFLCSVLTLAVSVALSRAAAAPPAPCCIGQQFSANIDETGGQVAGTGGKFIDVSVYRQSFIKMRTFVNNFFLVSRRCNHPTNKNIVIKIRNGSTSFVAHPFLHIQCISTSEITTMFLLVTERVISTLSAANALSTIWLHQQEDLCGGYSGAPHGHIPLQSGQRLLYGIRLHTAFIYFIVIKGYSSLVGYASILFHKK